MLKLLEIPNTKLLDKRDFNKGRKKMFRKNWKLRKGLLPLQLLRNKLLLLQSILMILRIPLFIADMSITKSE